MTTHYMKIFVGIEMTTHNVTITCYRSIYEMTNDFVRIYVRNDHSLSKAFKK